MLGGLNFRSITSETVIPAGIGAVGAIGLDVVYAYATPYLPNALTTGMIPYLVKLAGALGLGMVAGKIMGRSRGHMVALGATTVVAYGAIKGALSTALPTVKGLSGYADFVDYSVAPRPPGVGAYLTTGGPVAAPAGRLGFYSPASVVGGGSASLGRGVGAYLSPGGIGGFADPSGYDWRNDGM
ncbi:MAG: hypothetical protein ACREQ5_11420 [Candidatus Dormibacteria bacterium]